MKLIIATLIFTSTMTLAATKVVEKIRVLEEKIVSAHGCSVTGDYDNSGYGSAGYQYLVTMQVKVSQKLETYLVQLKKGLFRKATQTLVANSTKPAPERIIKKTQTITYQVRYPTEDYAQHLLKACENEMLFINTGSYPPPPPKPVIVPEPPKPVVIAPPTNPVVILPGLPENVPVLPDLSVKTPTPKK